MSDLDDALLTTLVFREAPGLLYYLWTTLLFRVALHLEDDNFTFYIRFIIKNLDSEYIIFNFYIRLRI